MKYKPVTKGYQGIVRVRESEDIFKRFHGAFVKLDRRYEFTGNPDHFVESRAYKTLKDLKEEKNPMESYAVRCQEKYLTKYIPKKNNYW